MTNRVLIVDDSLTVRMDLGDAFTAAGFVPTLCATLADARLALTGGAFVVAVIDVALPDGDGLTLVREIKAAPPAVAPLVMLLSTEGEVAARVRALGCGADEYIGQPYDRDSIVGRARRLALRPAQTPHRSALTDEPLAPKRILAVDDSLTYREELAQELRHEHYDVVLAASGQEALDVLATRAVDCILLDLVMPGLSGHDTCVRIKAVPAWRDIPLVILTAHDEGDAMIAGINAGADDYVTKASTFAALKARIRAQLRRKEFEDENHRIREHLLRREMEAAEARAARELAETRAALLADVQQKNAALASANAELQAAKDRAERESRFKSTFLANMSHELRTPLNAIIGFSEVLEQQLFGPLNPRQTEHIHHVLASGRHLLSLIDEILDLSKVEAGRVQLQLARTSVAMVVEAASAGVAPLAEKRRIELHLDIPSGIPDIALDPLRIKQVVYNLLSNGIKFTEPGGHVRVGVHVDDDLTISVADTGIGIRPEDIGRLFREFERLQAPEAEASTGTGLGLALTKRLVEMHDGSIDVESEPGRGTTFTVHLPLRRPAPLPVIGVR